MDKLRPGAIALIAGGAVLFISTWLKWGGDSAGASLDARGLQGLFCLLIGAGIVLAVVVENFGNQSISVNIAGFDKNDLMLTLGITAFLITFGLQFAEGSKAGVFIGWIGAAAIVVGAYMERGKRPDSTPPTPF